MEKKHFEWNYKGRGKTLKGFKQKGNSNIVACHFQHNFFAFKSMGSRLEEIHISAFACLTFASVSPAAPEQKH